jgi:dienelactone hydrolase
MVRLTIFMAAIFFPLLLTAQERQGVRYKDDVFERIKVDKDLNYLEGDKTQQKDHEFDLYQPDNDNLAALPLIIWMHGGGFKFGSKGVHEAELMCRAFAQRGYVCASINYRLSKSKFSFKFDDMQKSSYFAVQDARQAIEFFRKNHERFNIDPDKIIVAGNSAGGIMALLAAYTSDEELARHTGVNVTTKVALHNTQQPEKVAAVVNFWGAIYRLDWLKNARVPIVSICGNKDGIIPPTTSNGSMYGSVDIEKEAERVHIPHSLKVFTGYSHELQVHFNPFFADKGTEERWRKAVQFACDFLYEQLFK